MALAGRFPTYDFTINRFSPQAQHLLAWWPTQAARGTFLRDLSGSGITIDMASGAAAPAPVYDPEFGLVWEFDGVDDYALSANDPFSESDFSGGCAMAIWVRIDSYPPSAARLIGIEGRFELRESDAVSNTWALVMFDGVNHEVRADSTMALGVWTHLCGVWDTAEYRLYVNGVLQSAHSPITHFGTIDSVSRPIHIGANYAGNGNYLACRIASPVVYSYAPSADLIWQMSHEAKWDLYLPVRRFWPAVVIQPLAIVRIMSATVSLNEAATSYKWFVKLFQEVEGIAEDALRRARSIRLIAEAASISDAAFRRLRSARQLAEIVSISDSLARRAQAIFTLSEALAVSESLLQRMRSVRLLAEQLAVFDSLERRLRAVLSFSEQISVSDLETRVGGIVKVLASQLGIAESAVRRVKSIREMLSSISIADVNMRRLRSVRLFMETISLSDSIIRRLRSVRLLSEKVSISETLSRISGIVKVLSATLGIAEAAIRRATSIRLMSSTVSLSESLARRLRSVRLMSETERLVDAFARRARAIRLFSETVGVSDSSVRVPVLIKIISETISVIGSWLKSLVTSIIPTTKVEGRSYIELSRSADSEIMRTLNGRSYIHTGVSDDSPV